MKLQFPANFPCNEIMCPNYYFCSAVDLQCHHCNSYCKETKNNYDQEICARQCPEFINDFLGRFVSKRSVNDGQDDIEVECSPALTTIIVLLFIILVVIIIFVIFYILKTINKDLSILRFLGGKKPEDDDKENELIEKDDTLMEPQNPEPKLATFASIFGPCQLENSIWNEEEKNIIRTSNEKSRDESSYDNLGLQVHSEHKM